MTYFEAYLFTRLNSLNGSLSLIIVSAIIITLVSLMALGTAYGEDEKESKRKTFNKIWKITLPLSVMLLLLVTLIPNTKQAAFIYIAPKIVNNQDLQKTLTKLPKLTNLGLEYLNDMLEKKNENKN